MEFEVLKRSHLKRNIIIGVVAVFIISAAILNFTRAKYRVSDSVPIIYSKINYKVPDLNMVSLYIANEEGTYTEADIIPTSGYTLNTEQSYCGQSNNGEIVKDDTVSIVYENGLINVNGISKKGTKCYLYFDIIPSVSIGVAADVILANSTVSEEAPEFRQIAVDNEGMYLAIDSTGKNSYYFRGATDNNWVRFAGFYWRIIRINGDGSIRLIYSGIDNGSVQDSNRLGPTTQISLDSSTISYPFNSEYRLSEYAGLKYTLGSQHGQDNNSDILDTLITWYNGSGLVNYNSYLDLDIGFCSDRTMASGYTWSSQPTNTIRFAVYDRIARNYSPSLECIENDIIRVPVGLITADEVIFAGGSYSETNQNYYLYTNSRFWTISSCAFSGNGDCVGPWTVGGVGGIVMLNVNDNGYLRGSYASGSFGVRPVINLRSDVNLTGTGTSTDPYVVVS